MQCTLGSILFSLADLARAVPAQVSLEIAYRPVLPGEQHGDVMNDPAGWTSTSANFSFPRGHTAFWVRIQPAESVDPGQIPVDEDFAWRLSVHAPDLDRVWFWSWLDGRPDRAERFGDQFPLSVRAIRDIVPVFPLKWQPGAAQLRMLLRIESQVVPVVEITMRTRTAWDNINFDMRLLIGSFLGILLIMTVYHLVVWALTRTGVYLFYSLVVLGYLFLFVSTSGLGYIYIWTDQIWFQNFSPLASAIVINITLMGFLRHFLGGLFPSWYRMPAWLFVGLFLAIIPLGLLADDRTTLICFYSIQIPGIILAVVILTRAMLHSADVRIICLGFLASIFGVSLYMAGYLGVTTSPRLRLGVYMLGNVLELALFAIAMAHHLRRMQGLMLTVEHNQHETRKARAIQDALIARHHQQVPGIELSSWHRSAETVGGDWFGSFIDEKNQRIYLLMGDVNGHGLSSAMLTGAVAGVVKGYIESRHSFDQRMEDAVREVAGMVNNVVRETGGHDRLLMSMAFVCLDLHTHRGVYLNAGHHSLFQVSDQSASTLLVKGSLLGLKEKPELGVRPIAMAPGDVLFFYTDGLIENKGPAGHVLKASRLKRMLSGRPGESPADKVNRVVDYATGLWADEPLGDDCCVMAVGFRLAG